MSSLFKPQDTPPEAASALLAPTPAPISIGLDLAFVVITAILTGCAVVTQSLLLGAVVVLPVIYVVLVVLVRRPIWALGAALIVQHFSGFIKQALNYSQSAYLVQDAAFLIVLVPLVLRHIVHSPVAVRRQPWTLIDTLLVLFVVYSVIQAFNPASPSPLLGLAALRVRLLPILMYVFVRGLQREGYSLEKPLFWIMAICALCGALFAMYESVIGMSGVQALGPGFWPKQMSRTWGDAEGGMHFRPPSIYTDAGIAVVVAGMFAFMGLLRPYRLSLPANLFRYGIVLMCLTQVIVTGSRSGFLTVVVGLIFLAVFTRSRVLGSLLLVLPVVFGIAYLLQPQIVDRYATVSNPTEAYQKNRGYTLPLLAAQMRQYPFGFGTGTATVGAGNVATLFDIPLNDGQDTTIDNGWVNVLHETGILGLVLYVTLLLAILGYALRMAKGRSPQQAYLPLTMAVWTVVILISSFGGLMTDAFPINVYYWGALALMLGQKVPVAASQPEARPAVLTPLSGGAQ